VSAESDTCAQAAPFTQRRCKHTLRIRRRRTDGSHDPHAVIAQRLQHLKVAQHVVPAAWALGHRDAGNHRRTHPSGVVRENKVRPAFRLCSSQPMVGAWSFPYWLVPVRSDFLYFVKLSPKSPDRRTYGCGYHRLQSRLTSDSRVSDSCLFTVEGRLTHMSDNTVFVIRITTL
jgi:hypothetical protein